LILLKSKSLLPELSLAPEENRDIEILENQLKAYAILKERKVILKNLWNKNKLQNAKIKYKNTEKLFIPTPQMDKVFFYNYLKGKLNEIAPENKLKEVKVETRVKIEDALNHVRNVIKKIKKINLNILHENGDERLKEKNKKNVVILFLAILELTKIGEINVTQENLFADIIIEEEYAN
jgi:segregation and condensation protein A